MKALMEIFEKLGLTKDNGLFIYEDLEWEGLFSQKTGYALRRIRPDAFFCFNNEPLILFFESPENESDIHKKCWNFNKAPVIIVNTRSDLKIYNGFSFNVHKGLLHMLADKSKIKQFSYWNLVTGQLWKEYEKEFSKRKRLDYKLLQNIGDARSILIEEKELTPAIANKLIGRLVFTRYLIDRKIKIDFNDSNNGILANEELLTLIKDREALYDFFNFLNSRFKGDLFPLNGEKYDVEPEHLEVLYSLFKGEEIKTRQRSLFDIYNFDIIPIEFVSNIYEYFIGKDKQEQNKSFYTPPFLVDYVLSQTVGNFLKKDPSDFNCKVLDPACGSGIFLVEALRLLILRFRNANSHLKPSQPEFKEAIKRILVDNIFGIDKDRDALEISTFSLYITMLDFFEEPRDINGFEFPNLLETNLIEADFFNKKHTFNRRFGSGNDKINLDFILGNPPWGIVGSPYMEYIKSRAEKEENKIEISNKQIAQAYLLRISDFSNYNTQCCLIVYSKILYNLNADEFREYFVKHFYIDEIFEISPVRKEIFTKAVGPAAVIKYRYAFGRNTLENKVLHLSLKPNPFFNFFKSILIEKYDFKEVKQEFFAQHDWLWKVLIYGSVLDIYFIKRLKDKKNFRSISDLIEDEKNHLISGEGVQVGGGDSRDASHLVGLPLIETKKDSPDFSHFYINTDTGNKWTLTSVHRNRNKHIFQAPLLLIRGSTKSDFTIVAGTCDKDIVFKDSAFSIKSFQSKEILEHLLGVLSSQLATYFIFMTGSSTGVEREQIFSKELFEFPVVLSDDILPKVRTLLKLYKKKYEPEEIKLGGYDAEIEQTHKELNELIFKLYNLDAAERDMLDYAFNISIPILQDQTNTKPFSRLTDDELINYAGLFVDHFSQFHHDEKNGYFQVEIYRTPAVIALNFKIIPHKPADVITWIDSSKNEDVINMLTGLSFQKVSSRLFIQKDVKGIRKNSFYVIKPNQYKLWHPAIARLDIIEFENSMLQSQLTKEKDG